MPIPRLAPIASTLAPSNHPYLNGAWTPLHEEVDVAELQVTFGAIPEDLDGVYLRNTENQIHQPLGRYHPFDGDGMIHQISFSGGKASYRNRFVRTRGFQAEQEAGASLWGGLADPVHLAKRPGWGAHGFLKDASSTDIVVHAGKALSTFYQCGEGYLLDPLTLETLGLAPWVPIDGISAHPKVDEHTGELMFFNYSKHAPYLHYGLVDADGKLEVYQAVPTPGPPEPARPARIEVHRGRGRPCVFSPAPGDPGRSTCVELADRSSRPCVSAPNRRCLGHDAPSAAPTAFRNPLGARALSCGDPNREPARHHPTRPRYPVGGGHGSGRRYAGHRQAHERLWIV